MNGKTIRIFLVNGVPSGILTAEIGNWTGKIIVAPRSQLADLAKRDELKRTGAYCLIGSDPESSTRDMVYVGEGDSVIARLTAHNKDDSKDFWTRGAVIISKDENLTKSHGRYLESRLIGMGLAAGRAAMRNGTTPPLPLLPEPDIADMEFFVDQLQMVFPVLGFGFLLPKPIISIGNDGDTLHESPLFTTSLAGATATAREVGDEFVVLKGSTARKEGRNLKSWTSYRALHEQLVADGKLVESGKPGYLVFADDVPFNSPSAGAAVVNAGNINGRTAWKLAETGETYQEWYDKKLAAAGVNGIADSE